MKNGIYREDFKIDVEFYGQRIIETYKNCKIHYKNDEGYLVEHDNGAKNWIKDGKLHKIDGPAVIWPNGKKHWWLNGKHILVNFQKEFKRYLNTIAFR